MRAISIPPVASMVLVGGRLCLDFANTANRLDDEACDERLNSIRDLFTWGERQGLIDRKGRRRLAASAASDLAARDLARAIELREALWRLFAGAAAGRRPSLGADLRLLNAALHSETDSDLRAAGKGFAVTSGRGLTSWLWRPIAYSALELLTSPRLTRVRRCPGERCGWLFLDQSPNGRRRWCSMVTCGNRNKAQRHYAMSKRMR